MSVRPSNFGTFSSDTSTAADSAASTTPAFGRLAACSASSAVVNRNGITSERRMSRASVSIATTSFRQLRCLGEDVAQVAQQREISQLAGTAGVRATRRPSLSASAFSSPAAA